MLEICVLSGVAAIWLLVSTFAMRNLLAAPRLPPLADLPGGATNRRRFPSSLRPATRRCGLSKPCEVCWRSKMCDCRWSWSMTVRAMKRPKSWRGWLTRTRA